MPHEMRQAQATQQDDTPERELIRQQYLEAEARLAEANRKKRERLAAGGTEWNPLVVGSPIKLE